MLHQKKEPPAAVREALARLPDSAWTPVETTEDYVISETVIDIAGKPTIARRTVYREDDTLQALNQQQYNESDGKRWGDGRIVARIPLNKFYSELVPHIRKGNDRDHIRWWLNKDENRPFRTFRGKI